MKKPPDFYQSAKDTIYQFIGMADLDKEEQENLTQFVRKLEQKLKKFYYLGKGVSK